MALNKAMRRWEEIFLILIISLNIVKALGLLGELSKDIEFIESLVTFTALGYVLFHSSLSGILFGVKNKNIDILAILAYYLLAMHKIVRIVNTDLFDSYLLFDFAKVIINYSSIIILTCFLIGNILLALVSMYIVEKINIGKPSLCNAVFGITFKNKILKFAPVLLLLLAFYTVFFNLILEWVVLTLDAPILVIGVLFYIFKIHNLKELESEIFIVKTASFVDDVMQKFISLFKYRNMLPLGILGILVLHLLTDMGVFMIPYITNVEPTFYFTEGLSTHYPLLKHYNLDKMTVTLFKDRLMVIAGYLMNIIALTSLMLLPAYIWYLYYLKTLNRYRRLINPVILATFFSSLIALIFLPVFKIVSIKDFSMGTIGVDFQTQSILSNSNIIPYMIGSVITFIAVMLLSDRIGEFLHWVMLVIGNLFFGYYLLIYFISQLIFYLPKDIDTLLSLGNSTLMPLSIFSALNAILFLVYSFIFLIVIATIYLVGYKYSLTSIFELFRLRHLHQSDYENISQGR